MKTIIKAAPRRNPQDMEANTSRPENATTGTAMPYTLFQCLLFATNASILIVAMCGIGRPGA